MEFVWEMLVRILVTLLLLTLITVIGILIAEGWYWWNDK